MNNNNNNNNKQESYSRVSNHNKNNKNLEEDFDTDLKELRALEAAAQLEIFGNDDVAARPTVELVAPGVVFLRGLVSPREQVELMKGVLDAGRDFKKTRARNHNSYFLKTLAFNTHKDQQKIPPAFEQYSVRAMQMAHKADEAIPEQYVADYITSFVYPADSGKLTGHVDKVMGWVVLFSFGCSVKWWIKAPSMKERLYLDFASGDCLVFNGATERDIWHGIEQNGICKDTCPPYLGPLKEFRVSLQMRQTERNDNVVFWKKKKNEKRN